MAIHFSTKAVHSQPALGSLMKFLGQGLPLIQLKLHPVSLSDFLKHSTEFV